MKKGKLIEFYFYVAIFVFGIIFMVSSIHINKKEKTVIVKSELEKKDINYKVYLVENTAVPVEYLQMDKMYVAKLVDYIKFNYDLEYNTQDSLIYNVKGKMNVNYLTTDTIAVKPTVAEREYEFVPDTYVSEENLKKKINKSVDIKYNDYNVELAKIQEVLGLAVEANLDVVFTVKNEKTNKIIYTSIISIPLAKEAFSIENDSKDTSITTNTNKEDVSINSSKLLVGILILIISGFKAFKVADNSLNVIKENYYTISRDKILKTYGDIIAEMLVPMDLTGIQIADVRNFEQLIDVEEETRSPINFYEVKKHEEGHFIIIHNNIGYRYILRNRTTRR